MKLYNADCLSVLRDMTDNSIDSVVTDPPYGISFMGKSWDYDVPQVGIWKEVLRVLKPGGHALVACGTRTQHRMAVNLEDAGFEIRDIVAWVYGSGFPKSLNIGKSYNSLEIKEWSKIGNALNNIDPKTIMEVWKSNSINVQIVAEQSVKNQTIAGLVTQSENSVLQSVAENTNQEKLNTSVGIVEVSFTGHQATDIKTNIVLQNVEVEIKQSLDLVKSAGKLLQNQNHKSWSIFTAQCDVKEWLKENTMVNHKIDEVLKTLRGNQKYSSEEITNVLCAILTENLKLIILNQSKTFQGLDTKSQMDYASVINVIITEYTAENLISNTVAILKGKAVDKLQENEREVVGYAQSNPDLRDVGRISKENCGIDKLSFGQGQGAKRQQTPIDKGSSPYEGWGTALKPAMELWTLCRKPLEEKTVAKNVLKYGTGGINIDGCKVINPDLDPTYTCEEKDVMKKYGRFPANLIHDGSDEVVGLFPETKSGGKNTDNQKSQSIFLGEMNNTGNHYEDNSGSASRFFYCAKASKSERNKGLEGFEEHNIVTFATANGTSGKPSPISEGRNTKYKNNHPTVKPVALMQYLCRLITPVGGTVLDPFMGSGSTGIGAKQEGFGFIGCELDETYFKIAEARINSVPTKLF